MTLFFDAKWKTTALGTPIELFASQSLELLKDQAPIILLGGVHGDEPEGVRLANDTLTWLKTHTQGTVPWVVIPCLNVDGFQKRTRINGRGVDLNRNYPSKDWTSEAKSARYFPGSGPASEPEVKAMVELIETLRPRLLIHCHSWKPCIVGTGANARIDAERLAKNSGYGFQPEIGYPTPGSLSRYGWHDRQIPVICIEEQEGLSDLTTIWPRFKNAMEEIFTDPSLRGQSLKYDHIAFDLDDTLMDTTRLLVPVATSESCQAMITAGLNTNLEKCLAARKEFSNSSSRADVFKSLVGRFGVRDGSHAEDVERKGYEAFYHRKVDERITLFPQALELIKDLGQRYKLHLVTSGHQATQTAKIRILKLAPLFTSVHLVDHTQGMTKGKAFQKIMQDSHAPAHRHLSIGNRLDSDIAEAKALGWQTCWVRYGEHSSFEPGVSKTSLDRPDYTISNVSELVTACRL